MRFFLGAISVFSAAISAAGLNSAAAATDSDVVQIANVEFVHNYILAAKGIDIAINPNANPRQIVNNEYLMCAIDAANGGLTEWCDSKKYANREVVNIQTVIDAVDSMVNDVVSKDDVVSEDATLAHLQYSFTGATKLENTPYNLMGEFSDLWQAPVLPFLDNAFAGCVSLKTASLGSYAFNSFAPESARGIFENAGYNEGLDLWLFWNNKVPNTNNMTGVDNSKIKQIHVPYNLLAEYQNDPDWNSVINPVKFVPIFCSDIEMAPINGVPHLELSKLQEVVGDIDGNIWESAKIAGYCKMPGESEFFR
jgi:hypothetical protein